MLDASKFGRKEYTPFEVYMKALYEYFKDELDEEQQGPTRSAVELAEFQEDAVKKARRILARYDGVMIADSVGSGQDMDWQEAAGRLRLPHAAEGAGSLPGKSAVDVGKGAGRCDDLGARFCRRKNLDAKSLTPRTLADVDVVLLDESHNFRNRNAQRFGNLERVLGANAGRGRDGMRKKVILLYGDAGQQRPVRSLQPVLTHHPGRPQLLCCSRDWRSVSVFSASSARSTARHARQWRSSTCWKKSLSDGRGASSGRHTRKRQSPERRSTSQSAS